MNRSPRFVVCSATLAIVSFLCPSWAQASLLVYEGFNGYASGSLYKQSVTNTTGLTGTYGLLTGDQIFSNTQGLTFSNLQVSGGSASNSTTKASAIGVTLDASLSSYTGTLYGSYLVQLGSAPTTNSSVTVGVNTKSTTASDSRYFNSSADLSTNSSPGVSYTTTKNGVTSASPLTLSAGTTYALVSRYTNVGLATSASNPGVATLWVLTEAQFDHFKISGFDDDALDSALVGSSDSNVTMRINSAPLTDGSIYTFSGGIQFGLTSSAEGASFIIDEVRYGTSLNDVLPVPEPSLSALMIGTFSLAAVMKLVASKRSH